VEGDIFISRRGFLAGAVVVPLLPAPMLAQTTEQPLVVVNKDPSCGCCSAWAEHIEAAGFRVRSVEALDIAVAKRRLGVPAALASCHIAEVDGYIIEGHVPAAALRRLLAERPSATGLAVPGMPAGSPGMEIPGVAPDQYEVVLFGPSGETIFAAFLGAHEL
jgi:hypothetical protein